MEGQVCGHVCGPVCACVCACATAWARQSCGDSKDYQAVCLAGGDRESRHLLAVLPLSGCCETWSQPHVPMMAQGMQCPNAHTVTQALKLLFETATPSRGVHLYAKTRRQASPKNTRKQPTNPRNATSTIFKQSFQQGFQQHCKERKQRSKHHNHRTASTSSSSASTARHRTAPHLNHIASKQLQRHKSDLGYGSPRRTRGSTCSCIAPGPPPATGPTHPPPSPAPPSTPPLRRRKQRRRSLAATAVDPQ